MRSPQGQQKLDKAGDVNDKVRGLTEGRALAPGSKIKCLSYTHLRQMVVILHRMHPSDLLQAV